MSVKTAKRPRPKKRAKNAAIEDHVRTAAGRTWPLAEYEQRLLPELKAERDKMNRDRERQLEDLRDEALRLKELLAVVDRVTSNLPLDTYVPHDWSAGELIAIVSAAWQLAADLYASCGAAERALADAA